MRRKARGLALAAARTSDPRFADALARLALKRPTTFAELEDAARAGPDALEALLGEDPYAPALAWAGFVAAARDSDPSGLRCADHLLRAAVRRGGQKVLDPQLATLRAQVLHRRGRAGALPAALRHAKLPDDVAWSVRADRANPFLGGVGDVAQWLGVFGEPFRRSGLAEVDLLGDDGPDGRAPIHRLSAPHAAAGSVHGPLVSVVVPTYRPEAVDLETSVRSLVDQTWADLEILICDDASPPEDAELAERLAACDPRIRVVRSDRNRGAFLTRNAGLAAATGEFVTFNDTDDWCHPQQIERQMAPLLADDGLVLTLSNGVRASADLGVVDLARSPVGRMMTSSLFPRERVLQRVGGFDGVRRFGDREFVDRIIAVFGEERVERLDEPLGVVQLTAQSLSRDDYRLGWTHPARVDYKRSFRYWHDRIGAGEADPRIDTPARGDFAAPAHVLGVGAGQGTGTLALVADLDPRGRTALDIGAEVDVLADAYPGLVVVDAPALADLRYQSSPYVPALERRMAAGQVLRLDHGQGASVATVVLREPSAVHTLRHRAHPVHAEAALVVVDEPAMLRDAGDAEAHLRGAGVAVRWLPATPRLAKQLRAQLVEPSAVLAPRRWSEPPRPGSRPVARLGSLTVAYAPVVEDMAVSRARRLALAHPLHTVPDGVTVREARRSSVPGVDALPDDWESRPEVLASIDVVVMPAAGPARRGVRARALRCLTAGCLVVSDERTAEALGAGVIGVAADATGEALGTLLRALMDDPAVRDDAAAAAEATREALTPPPLADLVAELRAVGALPAPSVP